MSQPVLLKVYGHIWPAPEGLAEGLERMAAAALPAPAAICEDNGLVSISFEGIYFPLEEALSIMGAHFRGNEQGKLDVLDLEGWRMERYLIENGEINRHEAPLNNVLAWSGH